MAISYILHLYIILLKSSFYFDILDESFRIKRCIAFMKRSLTQVLVRIQLTFVVDIHPVWPHFRSNVTNRMIKLFFDASHQWYGQSVLQCNDT